ncbi:MAG TPA: DUF883 domain-containing protein [Burkholderiales bacterium]|nr:DUF883 domain-containing protein [Burkholderiales bacterium]
MSIETSAAKHLNALGGQKDKLVDDIKSVVADAEELLKKAKTSSSESVSSMRTELEDRLANSIVRLQEVQEELKWRARQAGKAADEYVHDNPWKSMGYVAVAGLIVGLLLTRGR